MKKLILISLINALFLGSQAAIAQEDMVDVFKDGYQVVHEACCITFDGCEYDKAYTVGPYVFICQEYGYSYNYGDVTILGKSISYQGMSFEDFYLCIDDDAECYEGDLLRR